MSLIEIDEDIFIIHVDIRKSTGRVLQETIVARSIEEAVGRVFMDLKKPSQFISAKIVSRYETKKKGRLK